MSFGAGFGSGMGAGMGPGIAVGICSGKKSAQNEIERNLRRFAATHSITIRDERGGEVPFDDFVEEVLGPRKEADKGTGWAVAVIVGLLLALVAAGLLLFNLVRG